MSNAQQEDGGIGNNEKEALQIQSANEAHSQSSDDDEGEGEGEGEGSVVSPICAYCDQDGIMAELVRMIIVDGLPFMFVEGEGFRKFMRVACPGFRIPSRLSVARDCYQLYVNERIKLKSFMKTNCERVCITTESWTSLQTINYVCVTAHFIDNEWNLHKKILNFVPVFSHGGEVLGEALENCLLDWDLKNVVTITIDNASSNDTTVAFLRRKMMDWGSGIASCKYLHMRCIAHIIGLVVCDVLKDINPLVNRVRDAVIYIRSSPARLKKFKECADLQGIESKSSLCLDVPKRWISTYLMLRTAEKFERVFEKFDELDSSFRADLGDVGVPTLLDWTCIRKYADLLKHFYKLTLRISASSSLYVASSSFFNEFSDLWYILNEWKESMDCETKSLGESMQKKFDRYWGDPEKMNKIIFWANVFDPRDKFEYMNYILGEMYGAEKGAKIFQGVRNELFELFNEYKEKYQLESEACYSKHNPHYSDVGDCEKDGTFLSTRARFKKYKMESGIARIKKNELEVYLNESIIDVPNLDVLKWWKVNSERFPIVSRMARDILAVPVSTLSSESAFSDSGRVLDEFRSSLTPKIVEALICGQDWLRESDFCTCVEEKLEELEDLEKELSDVEMEEA